MSEENRIEQEIGWYKVVFAILIATGISLLAWLVQNYQIKNNTILFLSVVGVFIISLAVYLINKKVFKCLDRLEEL